MKKMLMGVGLILAAGLLLLKDYIQLPDLGMPIWVLVVAVIFGFKSLQEAIRRHWRGSFISAVIVFTVLNWQFEWLKVSVFTIVLAAILLSQGVSMIFKPKKTSFVSEGKLMGADTLFKSGTRYVTDDALVDLSGDVVFGSSSLYFDHATMLGDKATYSGDVVFSSVTLYVPRDWRVELTGDHVFSSITVPAQNHVPHKTLVVTGDVVFSSFEVIYI